MLKIIVLAAFFIVTCIHLYASLKQDKPLRNKTKPFILLFLLAFYCICAEHISRTVVLALLFSWLGDILLIRKGLKWFTAGGISFMISHFFFIITYSGLTDYAEVRVIWKAVLPAVFFLSSTIIFRHLRPYLPNTLFYPMYLYLLINGAMNCFAWFRSMSAPRTPAELTAIGALLFFISDCSLFFVRFHKESRLKTHFLVMLTYSIGEFLIVLGLIP